MAFAAVAGLVVDGRAVVVDMVVVLCYHSAIPSIAEMYHVDGSPCSTGERPC